MLITLRLHFLVLGMNECLYKLHVIRNNTFTKIDSGYKY